MQRYELDSTSIKSAAWDPEGSEAEVEFRDGSKYRYRMPKPIFEHLLRVQSKGEYLAKYIKTRNKKWRRVTD